MHTVQTLFRHPGALQICRIPDAHQDNSNGNARCTVVLEKEQLLTNSTELAYQTIKCSSLNAEELRRENGLDHLNEAFSRCVNMLSQYSKEGDKAEMSVQVCMFITKCFAAAAQFDLCREKMLALTNLIKDLCRCLYFKNLPGLCLNAAEAVSAFAPDF